MPGMHVKAFKAPRYQDDLCLYGPRMEEASMKAGSYLLESTYQQDLKNYVVYTSCSPYNYGTICQRTWQSEGPLYQHPELGPYYADAARSAPPGLSEVDYMRYVVGTMTENEYIETYNCRNYEGTVDHYVSHSWNYPDNL